LQSIIYNNLKINKMAKTKSTPNLPASSRMQMPSGGGNMKATGSMAGKKGNATKKVMSMASKGKSTAKGY